VSWTLGSNIENLILKGTDDINAAGNNQHNELTGNSGNNELDGLFGNDTLIGGAGDDILYGGWGYDVLIGGTGADRLTGGRNRDIFRYLNENESGMSLETMDLISDFKSRVRMDLHRQANSGSTIRQVSCMAIPIMISMRISLSSLWVSKVLGFQILYSELSTIVSVLSCIATVLRSFFGCRAVALFLA